MPKSPSSPSIDQDGAKGKTNKIGTIMACLAILFTIGLCTQAVSKAERKMQPRQLSAKKILVAYFSHSGNTREIAEQIHRHVGGDLFEIVTVAPYPSEYQAVVEQAKREQTSGYKPRLKTKIKNIKPYDVVFIGYPNWWGTIPMPVVTFLSEYDFSGKIIAPFCTHEGSRLGRSVEDVTGLCPHSTIAEGLAVRGSTVKHAQNDVSNWLRKIRMAE